MITLTAKDRWNARKLQHEAFARWYIANKQYGYNMPAYMRPYVLGMS